jgi:hypothetical protein
MGTSLSKKHTQARLLLQALCVDIGCSRVYDPAVYTISISRETTIAGSDEDQQTPDPASSEAKGWSTG